MHESLVSHPAVASCHTLKSSIQWSNRSRQQIFSKKKRSKFRKNPKFWKKKLKKFWNKKKQNFETEKPKFWLFFTRFGHPMTENSDLVLSTIKPVKNRVEKFYASLVQSSEGPGWHSIECRVPPWYFGLDGSNSKILTWREYFASELCTNGDKSFSPEFFTHFGRPMIENSNSVLSTGVRPFPYVGTFDQWCD